MYKEINNFKEGYTSFYFRIMENAKSRTIDGYCEKHHVVPRSLGGSNANSNIAKLTTREHLIAHRLLIRMTVGKERRKMVFALQCMTWQSPKHKGERAKLTLLQHAKLRELVNQSRKGSKWSAEQKANQSLRKRGLYIAPEKPKRVTSEETKQKIRASLIGRGRPHTEATKIKMSASAKLRPIRIKSEEERLAISKRMQGNKLSEETKQKIRAKAKGRKASAATKAKMSLTRCKKSGYFK